MPSSIKILKYFKICKLSMIIKNLKIYISLKNINGFYNLKIFKKIQIEIFFF